MHIVIKTENEHEMVLDTALVWLFATEDRYYLNIHAEKTGYELTQKEYERVKKILVGSSPKFHESFNSEAVFSPTGDIV